MFRVLVAASSLAAVSGKAAILPALSDSACFERWSHFKDYGIPGTTSDPLNQAAIADGTCRMLGPDALKLDGFAMWNEPARVKAVLAALGDAPKTDRPSYFVRSVREKLLIPCSTPQDYVGYNFSVKSVAASLQNWYHALCAPESDPSWNDAFDPAEQPQQMAITSGLVCIVACDTSVDADAMAKYFENPDKMRTSICLALPWGKVDFTKATSYGELSGMAAPLYQNQTGTGTSTCNCAVPTVPAHGVLV